jgi:UDP-N-acetylmuramate dehydrogenase
MITVEENVNLRGFNTFGIDVTARYFCRVRSERDFVALMEHPLYRQTRVLILGGGSNVLFVAPFDGLVVKNELMGIHVVRETDELVELKVGAGENWHALVMHCVEKNWGGIENLSLIPGTVGAAPMQNIGAYGIEVKEVIKEVEAYDRQTGAKRTFSNEACAFGYRESVFKQQLKEKFFISSVTLTLTKKNHRINTQYGAIQHMLGEMGITAPALKDVSNVVMKIRTSKLPDPTQIGNAGSFFKNPSISKSQYEALLQTHPSMPGYFSENQYVKVPAGWLIEQCGWKGKRWNDAGVHAQQALVLVNYGHAQGQEIFSLAQQIQASVKKKFNIDLSTEVNVIG